jgi:hypothetical protein|tara:strand:+ start:488 stop:748 length:261 start_codon:yes stop_codon:yes gene_type:complete
LFDLKKTKKRELEECLFTDEVTTKRRKKEERKKNDELRTSATSLFLSEIVPISVSSQAVFVIIARRREVEEEPSARAHLLFPLTLR